MFSSDAPGETISGQARRRVCRRLTSERVDRRASALGDLGDDARGTSCSRHDVRERLEWAGAFAIWRRWFAVVKVLAGTSAVLGVVRERGLGLGNGGGSGR